MVDVNSIQDLIAEVLQLGHRAKNFDESTRLLGSIPEFDSMAVVTVITALEDRYDIVVEDDEISAETFETVGTLHAFVNEKL